MWTNAQDSLLLYLEKMTQNNFDFLRIYFAFIVVIGHLIGIHVLNFSRDMDYTLII